MPRGRQFYDPILQMPGTVQGPDDLARIELYPEVVGDVITRWSARRIHVDGTVAEEISGSADHDEVLARAQQTWANLSVYELKSEQEDSTWEGVGPSPRLWKTTEAPRPTLPLGDSAEHTPAVEAQLELRAFTVSAGTYMHIGDLLELLGSYAAQYDEQGNPSGALALREAAAALREPF